MKIVHEPTTYYKYAFEFPFSYDLLEFCRYLKAEYGWKQFGFSDKKWRFSDLKFVDLIKGRYPTIEIDPGMTGDIMLHDAERLAEEERTRRAYALKAATASNIKIRGLKGEPYPYQKIGVELLINNRGRAIIADEMGLGKTLQAIAYVVHEKIPKTLVICPASVKFAFEGEIKKWTKLRPFVFDSKSRDITSSEMFAALAEHDIFIINYDLLGKHKDILMNTRWDCLICDEFTHFKNNAAQRTKHVKMIAKRIPSIILLSGTPVLNRPAELFNGLHIIDPVVWNNFHDYTVRYCQGHQGPWGWDARGASNIPELQQRIGKYFIRRLKEGVLPELPPKQFIDIPVELDSGSRFEYDLVLNDFVAYLKENKHKNDAEINKSLQAEKLVRLGELRKITSMGKLSMAKEFINNMVDSGEKLVVFSAYNEPLEHLHNLMEKSSVLLIGKTDEQGRIDAINRFQNDPLVKVFYSGIRSGGMGITLTAASNLLHLDYSWTPAEQDQASARIHRIGQKASSVSIYQLYAKDTIDEKMKELLSSKREVFNQMFGSRGGGKPAPASVVNGLIGLLEKEQNL